MEETMELQNDQQLISYLKSKNVNYRLFDFREKDGKPIFKDVPFTSADDFSNIIAYRRYYENPKLWQLCINKNFAPAINYFIDKKKECIDRLLVVNMMGFEPYFKKVAANYFDLLTDEQEKIIDMDFLIMEAIEVNDVDAYFFLHKLAETKGIKPLENNFGNVGHGTGITRAIIACGDSEITRDLLKYNLDPSLDDHMSYINACRKGLYSIALQLIGKGAKVFTKHNLAYKMIKRNDEIGTVSQMTEKDKYAKKNLLAIYC